MSEPREGHNGGNELSPDERKSLMFHHYQKVVDQKAKVDLEREEYKRLRKLAKADGVTLADLDFMIRCAEVDDPEIVPDEIKRRAEIAAWFALPVDFQPDMFGDFKREPAEDRARREGRAAGASGKGDNPYDENSPTGRAWAEEWSKEQAKARDALKAAMEKKNAAAAEVADEEGDGTEVDPSDPIAAAADAAWGEAETTH